MSDFDGPVIGKKRGGLGRSSAINTDKIVGIVCGGVVTAQYATLGTIVEVLQLSDAEDLGFNAAYDTTNKVLIYNTLKRIFAYDPNAIVYLMVVAQTVTMTQMCDKANAYLYKLATDEFTGRSIKWFAVIRNPAVGYVPTYLTGLDTDVIGAIPKAQELVNDLKDRAIFVRGIIIEGKMDPAFTFSTLFNLRAQACDTVSVNVAQDPATVALDAAFVRCANMGDVLGMRTVRKVSECLGSVDIANKPESKKGTETYSLTDRANGYWLRGQLTSGKKFSDMSVTELNTLQTKGYIYAGKYEGLDGYFFNDSHTCILDSDDYAYQEDTAVWAKAAEYVRQALLPVMKGQVEVDPSTGFLPVSVIKYYESKAKSKVKQMTNAGEISGDPVIRIEANQDLVGTGKIFMEIAYVRQATLRKLEAQVGAFNPAVSS
jgi:hypothetical protein